MTLIAVDKEVVDGLVDALAHYRTTLAEYRTRLDDADKKADENTLMTIHQACTYLGGIAEETLLYYRKMGLSYFKKGREAVWYRKGDIDAWLASGKVNKRKL